MMSALAETSAQRAIPSRAPSAIVLSFYLWWTAIALQSAYIAYCGLTFAEAARIGGPAWDILFDLELPVLVVLFVTALEIGFTLLLRRGFRGSRIVLIAISVFMVPATFVTTAQVWRLVPYGIEMVDPAVPVVAVLVLVSATAIVTMYLPESNAFFRSHRPARDPEGLSPRPTLVVVAFWLWWPMIVLESLGLVLFAALIVGSFVAGPDWYYSVFVELIFAAPVVLLAGTLGLVMMLLVFRMRKGSRAARGWLLGLAVAAALLTLMELPEVIVLFATNWVAILAQVFDGVVVVLALVGAVIPFLPAAAAYYAKNPLVPEPTGDVPTPISG